MQFGLYHKPYYLCIRKLSNHLSINLTETKVMDNKSFNAQESIQLIEQTLQRSSQRIERASAKPLLIWGYVSVIVSLLVPTLLERISYKAHLAWALIPILGYTLSYFFVEKSESNRTRTFADRYAKVLWTILGVTMAIVSTKMGIQMGGESVLMGKAVTGFILSFVMLMSIIGLLTTGISLRIHAYTMGGALGAVLLATLTIFPSLWWEIDLYYPFALFFFLCMCLPGHYISLKKDKL